MPERCLDSAWTLSGWYLDKMNVSKSGFLQFHRRLNLHWSCLGSVLRVPGRCLDCVWTLSGWYLDLIGKVSGQSECIKIGFFTVPQKPLFSLEMSGECLESAREVSGLCLDLIRMVSGPYW